jgi:hypothetical protein
LNLEQAIEGIVFELLRTYQAAAKPPIKVLYILDDSCLAESFADQWIELNNHEIAYDILALDGEAAGWLGTHYVECTRSGGKCITIDEAAPAPLELSKLYDAIVMPEIDLDTASRVIHGLKGTVKSELLYAAIVMNKWVLIAGDCSGINRADRRTLQTLSLPVTYQKQFHKALQHLQEFGIELSETKAMAHKLIEHFQVKTEPVSSTIEPKNRMVNKLLSSDQVREWLRESDTNTLSVAKGTIVTALAADLIKENGIFLVQE